MFSLTAALWLAVVTISGSVEVTKEVEGRDMCIYRIGAAARYGADALGYQVETFTATPTFVEVVMFDKTGEAEDIRLTCFPLEEVE